MKFMFYRNQQKRLKLKVRNYFIHLFSFTIIYLDPTSSESLIERNYLQQQYTKPSPASSQVPIHPGTPTTTKKRSSSSTPKKAQFQRSSWKNS